MQQHNVIWFTIAVIAAAVVTLATYDGLAVSKGWMTLSQAWRNFLLANPFAILLLGMATMVPVVLVAHLVWSVWEIKKP